MGVVRRGEEWRLEKEDDGFYEVTCEEQPELRIITSDYAQRNPYQNSTQSTNLLLVAGKSCAPGS